MNEVFFHLSDAFVSQFSGKQPKWGPLGYITYKRTYARPLDEKGVTEEFWQTVKRVVEGTYTVQLRHCRQLGLPWNAHKAQKSAQRMFELMWNFKFLPPGRGLWMMGTDYMYKHGGAALNNCGFVSTKDIKTDFSAPFLFLMDMSMLGVGVGGDTKGAGTVTIKEPKIDGVYTVADTREGWVDSVRVILDAYVGRSLLPSAFDYSLVRKAGEPIKGFGGIASGPGPLCELHTILINTLNSYVGKDVDSTLIVDIFNLIGRCVVSGNVRRSAEILFGSHTDGEFIQLKDPGLHAEQLSHHRWASNNSIFAQVGMDYGKVAELTAKNGEPGYQWLDNARYYGRMADGFNLNADPDAEGANPCVEQTLESFELCCLVETFPSKCDTEEEYKEALKYAYLYAKSVTLVPTHNERTNQVLLRNRRIGTSQSGIVQSFKKYGRRQHLEMSSRGYSYLRELDRIYSRWLCVPVSIKVTSIKPSGTVSLLPGVTPGMHYDHDEYYYRTIRFSKTNPLIEPLRKSGYRIEDDHYDASSYVVYFPIKAEFFDRKKDDVSMWEQLEIAAQLQHYWSDNQVSATITFKPEEAKDIRNALELYETRLKGISFLPLSTHGYKQAPYISITKEEYEEYAKTLKPLKIKTNIANEEGNKYCDADFCELK